MKKSYFFLFLIFSLAIIFPSGCKKEKKKTEEKKKTTTTVESKKTDSSEIKIFYLVPSPDDIFGFANAPDLHYDPTLPNPPENLEKYDNTLLQELNFGIYSADLAYCAAFGKKEETKKYLDAVKQLSDNIGLSDVFNESLIHRINNLGTNKDSLIAISNDTYFDIIRYLEKNNRINTLAILAAGGWLETMYLVVNLTQYSKDNPTIQKIADQKIIFNNLYKFLEQNLNDPNVKEVYNDFQNLKEIFDQLKIIETKDKHNMSIDNDKIIVGGNVKIVMNKEQFIKLRNVINETRKKFTLQ